MILSALLAQNSAAKCRRLGDPLQGAYKNTSASPKKELADAPLCVCLLKTPEAPQALIRQEACADLLTVLRQVYPAILDRNIKQVGLGLALVVDRLHTNNPVIASDK